MNLVAQTNEAVGRLIILTDAVVGAKNLSPLLRRINRIRTIRGSLAIEGNTLIAGPVFHYEFEFIHLFVDGNGHMGRLWQTLILAHWNPLFADIPVESRVHEHQADYYQALQESTNQTDVAPFIEFMLRMILDAVSTTTPQVAPQVTPPIERLLESIQGEMSREELQNVLNLQDRKSFRERNLKPALEDGLIGMTIPGKPKAACSAIG